MLPSPVLSNCWGTPNWKARCGICGSSSTTPSRWPNRPRSSLHLEQAAAGLESFPSGAAATPDRQERQLRGRSGWIARSPSHRGHCQFVTPS
jgi:hypothetical protein